MEHWIILMALVALTAVIADYIIGRRHQIWVDGRRAICKRLFMTGMER